jgi:putative acetyltransferase
MRSRRSIRPAEEKDMEAVWRIRTDAILITCKEYYTPEQLRAWAGTSPDRTKYLSELTSRVFVVAEEPDGIVGFGLLNPGTHRISGIYVAPAKTRQGIGRQLLEQLEQAAIALGLPSIELYASLYSVPFYLRAGYRVLKETTQPLAEGIEAACVHMAKALSTPSAAQQTLAADEPRGGCSV